MKPHGVARRCARRVPGFFLGAAGALALLLAAAVPQTPSYEAGEIIRRLDLQAELPRDPPAESPPLGLQLPPELLWVPVIGGAAVLLYWLATRLLLGRARWDERGETLAAEGEDALPGMLADALSSANALAREGHFGEAMHLLLLHAVAAVRERLGDEIADSLTSREVLRSRRLSAAGKVSLGEIVGRVEKSHFGRYPASDDDYAACRAAFEGLLHAFETGGRA